MMWALVVIAGIFGFLLGRDSMSQKPVFVKVMKVVAAVAGVMLFIGVIVTFVFPDLINFDAFKSACDWMKP